MNVFKPQICRTSRLVNFLHHGRILAFMFRDMTTRPSQKTSSRKLQHGNYAELKMTCCIALELSARTTSNIELTKPCKRIPMVCCYTY